MNKKGVEIALSAVIIAIVCLVVLAVLIYVFTSNTGKVSSSFSNISGEAGKKAEESSWDINRLFGCNKEGETVCKAGARWICKDGAWEDSKQTCES